MSQLIKLRFPGDTKVEFSVKGKFSLSIYGNFSGSVTLERRLADDLPFNPVSEFKADEQVNGEDFVGNKYRLKVADDTTGELNCDVKLAYHIGV